MKRYRIARVKSRHNIMNEHFEIITQVWCVHKEFIGYPRTSKDFQKFSLIAGIRWFFLLRSGMVTEICNFHSRFFSINLFQTFFTILLSSLIFISDSICTMSWARESQQKTQSASQTGWKLTAEKIIRELQNYQIISTTHQQQNRNKEAKVDDRNHQAHDDGKKLKNHFDVEFGWNLSDDCLNFSKVFWSLIAEFTEIDDSVVFYYSNRFRKISEISCFFNEKVNCKLSILFSEMIASTS